MANTSPSKRPWHFFHAFAVPLSICLLTIPALAGTNAPAVDTAGLDHDLIAAIGSTARTAASQIPDGHIRLMFQINLAKALLDAGDLEDARATITVSVR